MTKQQYVINRKINIVELANTLGNISGACRKLGVSRQHYYNTKTTIEEDGRVCLMEKARNKPRVGNRVSESVEKRLLEYSLEFPAYGQVRVSNELKREGVMISPGGVRSVWLRYGLERKSLRLKRLEKWAQANSNVMTETQVKALGEAKEEKKAHGEIETLHPGYLLGQDTFYVGYTKGVGKFFEHTLIPTPILALLSFI